jgi:hypothetical protein
MQLNVHKTRKKRLCRNLMAHLIVYHRQKVVLNLLAISHIIS